MPVAVQPVRLAWAAGATAGLALIVAVAAVSPAFACALVLAGAALYLWPRQAQMAVPIALLAAVPFVIAAQPMLALAAVPLIVVAGIWPRIALSGAGLVLLAGITALRPGLGVLAGLTGAAGYALVHWRSAVLPVAVPIAKWALAALAVTAYLGIFLLWPASALLIMAVVIVLLVALRAPVAGLLLALLLYECEGAVKVILSIQGAPGPESPDAFAAALLDLGLLLAVGVLLWKDRFATPRELWRRTDTVERVVLLLIPAWVAVSVLQTLQGGDPVQGIEGFRLTQAYVVLALAGLVAYRLAPERVVSGFLWVGAILAGYAALRTLTGPLPAEQGYAEARDVAAILANDFRTVGSLTSAVGLASVLVPICVFSTVIGTFDRNRRALAWFSAVCAMVGIVGSYTRVAPVAVVIALLLTALFVLTTRERRRGLVVLAVVGGVLVLATVGIVVAGTSSQRASDRARGFVDPAGDASLNERVDGWRFWLETLPDAPLGRGVGEIGSATGSGVIVGAGPAGHGTFISPVTTDNSFLKVMVEQGLLGAPFFLAGLLALCALIALRLRALDPVVRLPGLAALAAFLSSLVLWLVGEYIEQPGKVPAWFLLGVAGGVAFLRRPGSHRPAGEPDSTASSPRPEPGSEDSPVAARSSGRRLPPG